MFENPAVEERCALLKRVKNVAVVGLSPKGSRPSHGVAAWLQRTGYRVIPVRPGVREVLGEKAYARLADVPDRIDLVDVFRRAEHVDEVVDECIALGIKSIWIQEGIVNERAAERARAAGMTVVMDLCIYKDYVGYCG